MSFFAMPAWEPPSGYRIPAWLRPPETMIPGIVPVELLLAASPVPTASSSLHMFIRDWHRTIAKAQAWEEKNEPVIQGQRA